jgi:hypothetical protein
MPGFLGGSTGGSGTGGEISFPKEFIDPVTKLRISQPENLIDTDFEYGLQPTKWETVELINNTPSFFSKSGDTTIPNIVSITTNAGTREITVVCGLEHGVSVGIPIQVTGTKSITADGSYIINSIPNTTTFTYLCKANQPTTASIEDLYSSILTGEFFQGAQLRVADASGIVTNNAEGTSTLTVTTESAHGFKTNTPFYFLNLNSTISKDFQASNTAAKSFDSTNSAVAQTFDGSNTLSSINIDWSNSATVGGVTSNISGVSTINNTITVAHSTENFAGQVLGTPLYYAVTSGGGYFSTNPRGVVFLKSIGTLGTSTSTFQVSATPDGDVIPITAALAGTFQLANQARTFAGNNLNSLTQSTLTVLRESSIEFDGGNRGYAGLETNGLCTVEGYAGTILVSTTAGAGLDYYVGAMVRYNTTGSAASGLTNNRTYFIASFTTTATPNQYRITIKELPTDASALAPTGGSGDQTFTKIGVSTDKDIVHIRDSSYAVKDMLEYTFPVGGRFTTAETAKQFYFVTLAYDTHNYQLSEVVESFVTATGGVTSDVVIRGATYKVHTFTTVGSSNTFTVTSAGSSGQVEYLVVAGGGGGGDSYGGGGGGGGGVRAGTLTVTAQAYTITVGGGGTAGGNASSSPATIGGNSVFSSITATGGGRGGGQIQGAGVGGSGGGGAAANQGASLSGASGTAGQGNAGGAGTVSGAASGFHGGGGGGAGTAGTAATNPQAGRGGEGILSTISGAAVFYGGGGGGGRHAITGVAAPGGSGGGALGGDYAPDDANGAGKAGAANTGGGGGGSGGRYGINPAIGGAGGSGIVILRYPTTVPAPITTIASGGALSTTVVGDTTYRVHTFATVGTTPFVVSTAGNLGPAEYLIVAGGGGGGGSFSNTTSGGGAGAGGFLTGSLNLSVQSYSIVVGGGGVGSLGSNPTNTNGGNSSAFGLTAIGGGRGGSWDSPTELIRRPNAGGSGGGQSDTANTRTGAAGTAGQGFAGGGGPAYAGSVQMGSGGGGGAGSAGGEGTGNANGGDGGAGRVSSITGTALIYAAGGGGGVGAGGTGGFGTTGVSGNGGTYRTNGQTAAANRGGGGGGGGGTAEGGDEFRGGDGGSGVVIIRYPISITGII